MIKVKEIEDFLKESVNDLLNGGEGTWFKYLGNDLYLVTGWAGDNELCSKVAVNQSSLQSDYEIDFNQPYFSDGELYDSEHCWTDEGKRKEEDNAYNFDKWADLFLDDYLRLSKMEISEDGEIINDNSSITENLYNNEDDLDVLEVYRVHVVDNTGHEDFEDFEDEDDARDYFDKEVLSLNNYEVNLIHYVEDDPYNTEIMDHWDIESAEKELGESIKTKSGLKKIKNLNLKEDLKEDSISVVSVQDNQVTEPEGAKEAQVPTYADAARNLKKISKIRNNKINADLENVKDKDFTIGRERKLILDESLFTDDLTEALEANENLVEAKGFIGTQPGEIRGNYKKRDEETLPEKVAREIEELVVKATRPDGTRIFKTLTAFADPNTENGFYFRTKSQKLAQKGKNILNKYGLSYTEKGDIVSWKFEPDQIGELDLSKVSAKTRELFKEEFDKDWFYTYQALKNVGSVQDYSEEFEFEDEAINFAKDHDYESVVRYYYPIIDNADETWDFIDYVNYGHPKYSEEIWSNSDNLNEAKGRTKEIAVLQGNYGSGWEDLIEYELDDMSRRQDLKNYNENEEGVPHRIIHRRVPRELASE